MNHKELLSCYLAAFIHNLSQHRVKTAVISPGSRSTPLAILLEECPQIRTYINVDERSAGFLAVGLAKALDQPVALLCTSGTAAANYYPAVIEAYFSRVPLLVITSDRPYELQRVAAPQTIGQRDLYGSHVRQSFELAFSEKDLSLIDYNQALTSRALAIADGFMKGPVHMNMPFREPLMPCRFREADALLVKAGVHAGPNVCQGTFALDRQQFRHIAGQINAATKGVIVCGDLGGHVLPEIAALAVHAGYPLLADPLSQLRRGKSATDTAVIDTYDTFLRDERTASYFQPDLIIRFGAPPVSKAVKLWMERQKCMNLVIDSGTDWRDPISKATAVIYSDEQQFCSGLIPLLEQKRDKAWLQSWQTVNRITRQMLLRIGDERTVSEEKLFLHMAAQLPEKMSLIVGNSMPIRQLDRFWFSRPQAVRLFANRGANGIDGVVSTAVGVALANGRATLVIGDLSFYHDMNGLLAAKQYRANLTIILINNNGGGIFSHLPQAKESSAATFETLFGTPHGLDFAYTAQLYGAAYSKITGWEHFAAVCNKAYAAGGLNIIEVPTERSAEAAAYRELQKKLSICLKEVLKDEG